MEALVVAQDRNQYYERSGALGLVRGFRGINCRTFQSGTAVHSTPLKARNTPVTNDSFLSSPKTPLPSVKSRLEEPKHSKRIVKSSTISIPINITADFNKEGSFSDDFPSSELWAGPAYSNSPLPSCLPIPKFSLHSKRMFLLDLSASSASDTDVHPTAKPAPSSLSRDHENSPNRDLFHSADSATKTLCRILNLDISNE